MGLDQVLSQDQVSVCLSPQVDGLNQMDWGRTRRNQKNDEKEPPKQKNTTTARDSSGKVDQDNMAPADIIKAINDLKTDLKGDNNTLRQEITHLGQEINGKLDMLGAEVHNLSDRVEEAE
ncbi:unnamed protein product [Xyrichtys novacula]|uniref:Unnamed protein product n=1 Tax=Xyrichtys novacula TaxID=13765 RepID=A0AAV1FE23_XYRNO|nr:unnamed protein product [Xyrichtys novacula]